MAWTWYQMLLALVMVVTGSINTLATKWADRVKSVNSNGDEIEFNHPFLQACAMFLGELLCLFVFKICYCIYKRQAKREETVIKEKEPVIIEGSQNFNPVIFLAPAMCDMTATSTMYIGLNLTYASSFQMLRGAVIVFTGLLSVAFLDKRMKKQEWVGIAVVIMGLFCVGLSDFFFPDKNVTYSRNSIITGDLLIVMAQIIVATQMVVEEKFITSHNVPPLQGVGWEGFFGFVILSILLVPMYFIKVGNTIFNNPGGRLEDPFDAFVQMRNSWQVSMAISGTIISIAFFNFAGLSVTKEMSATTRMVLDSVRTFFIWIFSMIVGWQHFQWLQLLGFIVLLIGMCLYNDIIPKPLFKKIQEKFRSEDHYEPLLKETDEQEQSPNFRSKSINC